MSIENIPMATPEDLAALDRLIKPQEPPERIYDWLDSQFSIARHYGGMVYQGVRYVIDPKTAGAPLVRADVLVRDRLAEKKAKCKAWHDAKVAAKTAQGVLL
jgi:hypothetical protein